MTLHSASTRGALPAIALALLSLTLASALPPAHGDVATAPTTAPTASPVVGPLLLYGADPTDPLDPAEPYVPVY